MKNQLFNLGDLAENLTNKELMGIISSLFNIYMVVLVDSSGDVVKVNERFLNTFHYSNDEIGELKIKKIISEYEKSNFQQTVNEDIDRQKYWSGQLRLKDKSNQNIDAMVHIIEWRSGCEQTRSFLFLLSPLSSVNEYERWRELAYKDELTGLPNLRKFRESISFQIQKSAQQKSEFALLFIDIDDFKKINDQYGHITGDKFLKECALRLEEALSNNHLIFRKSGDEFIIIVEDVEQIAEVRDDILKQLMKKFHVENHQFLVNVSIGMGIYPDHGDSIEALLHFADRAMYENKRENKFLRKEIPHRSEKCE
ncbi:MAG TPA: GGDEF domain-containing protein [Bacillales bacterium]|nr:GGDEF domain-containing protein [Bacillales bacterium]